jgi:hypothetical protein
MFEQVSSVKPEVSQAHADMKEHSLSDLTYLPALTLAHMLRSRDISSQELVRSSNASTP